ncbi:MAG: hypothetical protein ACLP01_00215 [Solirubrobacteraceae bacterium]
MLLVAALLLAACGSSSASSSTVGAAGQVPVKANGSLAFAKCMRASGVPNFPDPGANGTGSLQIAASQRAGSGASLSVNGVPVNGPAFRAAMTKCSPELPHNGGQVPLAEMQANALAMARCMRAHGVPNFPDPTVRSGPGGGVAVRIGGPGSGVDPSSPAFQSANKTCMPLMSKGISGAGQLSKAP